MTDISFVDRCIYMARIYSVTMRRMDAKFSAVHGLSFGDFMILHHLKHAHDGRLRRTDLAELMGVTASSITKSLAPLEKIGLVSRQKDARDARVGYAALTDAGGERYGDALVSAQTHCRELYLDALKEWEKVSNLSII